jgi:hypothetical protein
MAAPASQIIAQWVCCSELHTDWKLLKDVCFSVLVIRLSGRSTEEIWDIVEDRLPYVAENLRDDIARREADGIPVDLEVDNEASPYIRGKVAFDRSLLSKLRRIEPRSFEVVCANILAKLRAQSEVTKATRDGGVDFFAVDFDFIPDGLPTPVACRAAVIGQAKRYAESNLISENDIRTFVGGATLRRHELQQEGRIFPLSPVSFAFWTTSDFGSDARAYARKTGIWTMEGRALAKYIEELGMTAEVMALPDAIP